MSVQKINFKTYQITQAIVGSRKKSRQCIVIRNRSRKGAGKGGERAENAARRRRGPSIHFRQQSSGEICAKYPLVQILFFESPPLTKIQILRFQLQHFRRKWF